MLPVRGRDAVVPSPFRFSRRRAARRGGGLGHDKRPARGSAPALAGLVQGVVLERVRPGLEIHVRNRCDYLRVGPAEAPAIKGAEVEDFFLGARAILCFVPRKVGIGQAD